MMTVRECEQSVSALTEKKKLFHQRYALALREEETLQKIGVLHKLGNGGTRVSSLMRKHISALGESIEFATQQLQLARLSIGGDQ